MLVDINILRPIFVTLPIGLYLKRDIRTELSETSKDSYYDPIGDLLVVSAPTIIRTANYLIKKGIKLNYDELEKLIRGLFYHEMSHAILTGPNYFEGIKSFVDKDSYFADIANIVEDERIETILKDYYLLTNFRENIILINQFEGQAPRDPEDAFYQFIRFHVAEQKWLNRLEQLLTRFVNLNAKSSANAWSDYFAEVERLHKDFVKDYKPAPQNKTNGNGNGDGNNDNNGANVGDNISDDADGENQTDANENGNGKSKLPDEFNLPNTGRGLDNPVMNRALEQVTNQFINAQLSARLQKIIDNVNKKKGMFGGKYNSYSGRLDPRSCGREDCKFWTKSGDISANRYNKTHFNLFIDNSWSFKNNDEKINELLRALMQFISETFDFDVITINTKIVEWETPNAHIFKSDGGTDLNNKIKDVYEKHQKNQCNNYNIVVFDGEAHETCSWRDEPFKVFDTKNTVLVVDEKNRKFVKGLSNCALKIVSDNYANHFINTVLDLLEQVIK